ncbi:MAG: hypothetical protein ACLGH8_01615 [Bacteroidia bacterium]
MREVFKYVFVLSLMMLSCRLNAQKSMFQKIAVADSDCAFRCEKAKEMYAKLYNSDAAVQYRQARDNFFSKLPKGEHPDDANALTCEDKVLLWTEKNIEKTSFSDYNQAKQLWEARKQASAKLMNENEAFHNYMRETAKNCSQDSFKKLLNDLIRTYGKDFHI